MSGPQNEIERRFVGLQRRVAAVRLTSSLMWGTAALVVALVTIVGLDAGIRSESPLWRWSLSGLAAAAALIVPTFAARRSIQGTPTVFGLARDVEQRIPRLADQITSALSFLQQPTAEDGFGSLDLRRHVVLRTANAIERLDFGPFVPWPALTRAMVGLAGVAVVVAGLTWAAAPTARHGLARLAAPWRHAPYPRQTELQVVEPPTWRYVGEPMGLIATDLRRGDVPADVRLELQPLQPRDGHPPSHRRDSPSRPVEDEPSWIVAGPVETLTPEIIPVRSRGREPSPVERLVAVFDQPINRSVRYRVVGGDDRSMVWQTLEVMPRPVLDDLRLVVTPPAYARQRPTTPSRSITALAGSTVELSGQVQPAVGSLELAFATPTRSTTFRRTVPADPGTGAFLWPDRHSGLSRADLGGGLPTDDEPWTLDESGTLSVGWRRPPGATRRFQWPPGLLIPSNEPVIFEVAVAGGRKPAAFPVQVVPDHPPSLTVSTPEVGEPITANGQIVWQATASDDWGVARVELIVEDDGRGPGRDTTEEPATSRSRRFDLWHDPVTLAVISSSLEKPGKPTRTGDPLTDRNATATLTDPRLPWEGSVQVGLVAGPGELGEKGEPPPSAEVRITATWNLASLEPLPVGAIVKARLAVWDGRGQVTSSTPRRFQIVSDADMAARIIAQQSDVLGKLSEAIERQRQAVTATRSMSEDAFRNEGRAGEIEAAIPRWQSASIIQADVRTRLTSPPAGVTSEIERVLNRIERNQLEMRDNEARLMAMRMAIEAVGQDMLADADEGMRRLGTTLSRLAAAPPSVSVESQPAPPSDAVEEDWEPNDVQLGDLLATTTEAQRQVIEQLSRVVQDFADWDQRQRYRQDLRHIASDQARVAEDVSTALVASSGTMLTGRDSPRGDGQRGRPNDPDPTVGPPRRAELRERQLALAERFEALRLQIESALGHADAGTSPPVEAILAEALANSPAAGQMRQAVASLDRHDWGQTDQLQREIESELARLETLLDGGTDDPRFDQILTREQILATLIRLRADQAALADAHAARVRAGRVVPGRAVAEESQQQAILANRVAQLASGIRDAPAFPPVLTRTADAMRRAALALARQGTDATVASWQAEARDRLDLFVQALEPELGTKAPDPGRPPEIPPHPPAENAGGPPIRFDDQVRLLALAQRRINERTDPAISEDALPNVSETDERQAEHFRWLEAEQSELTDLIERLQGRAASAGDSEGQP